MNLLFSGIRFVFLNQRTNLVVFLKEKLYVEINGDILFIIVTVELYAKPYWWCAMGRRSKLEKHYSYQQWKGSVKFTPQKHFMKMWYYRFPKVKESTVNTLFVGTLMIVRNTDRQRVYVSLMLTLS